MIIGGNIRNRYIFLLVVLYYISYLIFNLKLTSYINIMLLFLLFFYYLFDILNFKDHNLQRNTASVSVLINFFIFLIILIKIKNIKIIYIGIIFSIFQIFLKKLVINKYKKIMNVLIIDDGKHIQKLTKILNKNIKYNYVGYLNEKELKNDKYLGKISNILDILDKFCIKGIIFTDNKKIKNFSKLILKIKMSGVRVIDYINFLELVEGKIDSENINIMWILNSSKFKNLNDTFEKKIKRLLDIAFSLILIIILMPLLLLISIIIKKDGGPAFFKQPRLGYLGNEFNIIKFRSMKVHDPNKFSKYSSKNDARITKIGKILRNSRLDELPQLFNILKGEMSFVGPRPEWKDLGEKYEKKIKNYNLRYSIRPGVTGWAQTMYLYSSNVKEAKEKLDFDLFYIEHQNISLDALILFKTIKIVLFGKGI